MGMHDVECRRAIPLVAGEEKELRRWREPTHRVHGLLVSEARRGLERGEIWPDRPLIDVVAAWRLLVVVPLRGVKGETRPIGVDELENAAREAERGGEENVDGCSTIDEIARDRRARLLGTVRVTEHPLRGCRPMIDVDGIQVGAVIQQKIDYSP